MDWPTRDELIGEILHWEPGAAADAILALFEPLRAEIEEADEIARVSLDYARQWRSAIGAEHLPLDEPLLIGLAKGMRAELAALRPVARAALIEDQAHTEYQECGPSSLMARRHHWIAMQVACRAVIRTLPPALRARLLEGT